MSWRTVLGLLLLGIAILSGWSAWHQRPSHTAGEQTVQPTDYVLHDFTIVSLGKDGKESTMLKGPEMERLRSDRTYTLRTPLFLLPDAQGRYWQLRSNTGWISADGKEIRLRGNVSGDSPAVPEVRPTTLRTDSLDAFPDTHQVRTAAAVVMTQPGIMQSGVGFQADLKTRQYTLLSQVKSRYEPNAARR